MHTAPSQVEKLNPGPNQIETMRTSPSQIGNISPGPSRIEKIYPIHNQVNNINPVPTKIEKISPFPSKSGKVNLIPHKVGKLNPILNPNPVSYQLERITPVHNQFGKTNSVPTQAEKINPPPITFRKINRVPNLIRRKNPVPIHFRRGSPLRKQTRKFLTSKFVTSNVRYPEGRKLSEKEEEFHQLSLTKPPIKHTLHNDTSHYSTKKCEINCKSIASKPLLAPTPSAPEHNQTIKITLMNMKNMVNDILKNHTRLNNTEKNTKMEMSETKDSDLNNNLSPSLLPVSTTVHSHPSLQQNLSLFQALSPLMQMEADEAGILL